MLVRGGKMMHWIVKPEGDPVWSSEDWARAATLEARYAAKGVSESERRKLVQCAVFKKKWPETKFTTAIESQLKALSIM